MAALLFQPGFYATDGIPDGSIEDLAALGGLREYLSQFYPAHHPALFVRAPFGLLDEGYLARRRLDELEMGSVDDLRDTSLYLPAVAA